MAGKRRDKKRVVLRTGESYRECDGRYFYRWTDMLGKRHSIYAKNLDELRKKEDGVTRNTLDGIRADSSAITLNDIFEVWKKVKRGLKDSTFQSYCYVYSTYVANSLGKMKVTSVKKTDMRCFYNSLVDDNGLKVSSIHTIHTVIHQLFDLAVDDSYIHLNPSTGALRDLNREQSGLKPKKCMALTESQEKAFLEYVRNSRCYSRMYPMFTVMVGTGLRLGEIAGLRWQDIDLDSGIIDVNHTVIYYAHRTVKPGQKKGYYSVVNSPKTLTSKRKVPMLDFVKEAFIMEKERQEKLSIHYNTAIGNYTNFIFLTQWGTVFTTQNLNQIIRRIIHRYNSKIVKADSGKALLPDFTCHSLRHTFATRMCEKGVNFKVIQTVMGHTDVRTTMDIYTDATSDMKNAAFLKLNEQYYGINSDTNQHFTEEKSDTNLTPNGRK